MRIDNWKKTNMQYTLLNFPYWNPPPYFISDNAIFCVTFKSVGIHIHALKAISHLFQRRCVSGRIYSSKFTYDKFDKCVQYDYFFSIYIFTSPNIPISISMLSIFLPKQNNINFIWKGKIIFIFLSHALIKNSKTLYL